jgi:hypothetical protein
MSFKIKQDPTFPGTIKLVSLGREQDLNVTFRAKTASEYDALVKNKEDPRGEAAFLALVSSWDADMPLDEKSVALLNEHQPGSVWQVVLHYGEALVTARKGN